MLIWYEIHFMLVLKNFKINKIYDHAEYIKKYLQRQKYSVLPNVLHNFTIENNGFITLSAKMHLMEGLLSRG